jgi:hypothetical protein
VCQAAGVDAATASVLVQESTKRAGLIWVRRQGTDQSARPLWHAWADGRVYLLGGGIEQRLPAGLDAENIGADTKAEVTVASKDKGSRLVTWVADVTVVTLDADDWGAAVAALQAKRLNSPDGDAAPRRWAAEGTVLRLTPTGDVLETPAAAAAI